MKMQKHDYPGIGETLYSAVLDNGLVRAAFDRSTGELTYIPKEGETPDNVTVTAPKLEYLMTITGRKEDTRRFSGQT